MGTKWAKKALLEVIPPRICVTFRRGSFWFRPKTSKMQIWKPRPENTTNTMSGSRPDFSEKSENHKNRSELDPYSTSRAENQAIWNLKAPWIQWDPSGTPKLPYKNQNQPKIQWTPPGTVYTKLFRQPCDRWFANEHANELTCKWQETGASANVGDGWFANEDILLSRQCKMFGLSKTVVFEQSCLSKTVVVSSID